MALNYNAQEIGELMSNLDLTQLQDSSGATKVVNQTLNVANATAKVAMPAFGLTRYMIDAESPVNGGDAVAMANALLQWRP